jgi:D-alanyl-D-alanine dipeptidase
MQVFKKHTEIEVINGGNTWSPAPLHVKFNSMNLEVFLKNHSNLVELIPNRNIILANTYYHMNLKGTHPRMFLREGVWKKLQEVAILLPENLGLYLFDGYRSLETQRDLFLYMKKQISTQSPALSEEDIMNKTREFVADPFNESIRHRLSHPTGGAIDLGLFDLHSKEPLDMGSGFDDPSEQSSTFYYEENSSSATDHFKQRRAVLFKAMTNVGFTNYAKEWWHYDMGDFSWAKKMQCTWHYPIEEYFPLTRKA